MISEPNQLNKTDHASIIIENTSRFRSMDQSPDGRYLACGCFDGQIKIYDLETLKQFGSDLLGHSEACDLIKYSPDGQLMATVGFNQPQIRIWNVKTQQQVGCLEGHTNDVYSLGFSRVGEYIVSGSYDHSIRIWNCKTFKQDGDSIIGDSVVRSVQYSPNGQHIVSGTDSGSVMIWEAATKHQVRILKGHLHTVRLVQYSLDGTLIASVCDKKILIHDVQTGQEISRILLEGDGNVNSVAITLDFQFMLLDRYYCPWREIWNDSIELYSIVSGKNVCVEDFGNTDIYQVQFSRDGTFIRFIAELTVQMKRLATITQKL